LANLNYDYFPPWAGEIPKLSAKDIRDVLKSTVSKTDFANDSKRILKTRDSLNDCLKAIVVVKRSDPWKETLASAKAMAKTTEDIQAVMAVFKSVIHSNNDIKTVASLLHHSDFASRLAPIVAAYCEVSKASAPLEELARALLGMKVLPEATALVANRLFSDSRIMAEMSNVPGSPARAYAFKIIDGYRDLTGELPRMSRSKNVSTENQPSGPLVRFIQEIFEKTHFHLKIVDYADILESGWTQPKPETIARWIQLYRRSLSIGDMVI
jgi:hypothetical protein